MNQIEEQSKFSDVNEKCSFVIFYPCFHMLHCNYGDDQDEVFAL